jgi:hypothetical protein
VFVIREGVFGTLGNPERLGFWLRFIERINH